MYYENIRKTCDEWNADMKYLYVYILYYVVAYENSVRVVHMNNI